MSEPQPFVKIKIADQNRPHLRSMKMLYDPTSPQEAGFEPIVGGRPSGLLNMSKCRYEWAVKIYKRMMELEWTPNDVNTAGEAKRYLELSDAERRMYDLAFAQLSFDDAGQSDAIQLLNRLITNKVISACIHRISYEEVNHSTSYAVLLQDTTNDADRVFNLYKSDRELSLKNQWISDRYEEYYRKGDAFMLAIMAQIVEGMIFLAGFVAIFSLGQKMNASAQMVAYISKDELNSHLPFFANVAKTIGREVPSADRSREVFQLIDNAVHLETDWLCYITKGVLGFTPEIAFQFVQSVADERLIALGLPKQYSVERNHLNKLLDSYTKVNDKKSNFFESKSSTYSKQLNMDDF